MTEELLQSFTLEELADELSRRSGLATGAVPGTDVTKSSAQGDGTAETELSRSELQLQALDGKAIHKEIIKRQKVVYGVDGRQDLYMVGDEQVLRNAAAVVSLFSAAHIVDNGDGTSMLKTNPFLTRTFNGLDHPLCDDEPFRGQPLGPFCSGVLVAPDIVATAGHCVDYCSDEAALAGIRFVFGFRMRSAAEAITSLNNKDIYRGERLIKCVYEANGADWALVKLDRPVADRPVAAVSRAGKIGDGTAVYVIGHPVGLPAKFAPGAVVKNNMASTHFEATLDTYGGNSGSGVFNEETHKIEGLLVRGATDFVLVDGCARSNVIPDSGPGGEACTRVSEFNALIASAQESMQNAHALVIGISDYGHIAKLPSTVAKDARDIRDLLIDPQFGGYVPENVKTLVDQEATLANIREELARLAARCDEDSSVFIFASCHGGRVAGGPFHGEYLLPVDTVYESAESLAQSAISGMEFTKALEALAARKVFVVFDCCHAGGIGQPKSKDDLGFERLPTAYYDELAGGHGRAVLASSESNEYSYILEGAENSVFTHHFLEGLRGGIVSNDKFIRIFDVFDYLQPRVTQDQPNQHPILRSVLRDNFPIALRLGGQKGQVPVDTQGYRYDAYVSYVEQDPDYSWVHDTLVPYMIDAGLRVALSGDVEAGELGVDRVVSIERGIEQSKRILLILSPAYLENYWAKFENVMAQEIGIEEGKYRLIPISFEPVDRSQIPLRIRMLTMLNLTPPRRPERELARLVEALKGPVPVR